MDAVRLLGEILEANATGGQVLGELLERNAGSDALDGVIGLFAVGTVASGFPYSTTADGGLLVTLAAGGAPPVDHDSQSEAIMLIGALCNAAKVDGPLTDEARESVLSNVLNLTEEARSFLGATLAAPLDLRDFATGVSARMAHPVYAFSMLGLPATTKQQVQFLSTIAQGLGVDWIAAKKIHAELGGPTIFG